MSGYTHYIKTKVVGADTLVVDGYADWQTDKYDPADTPLSGVHERHFTLTLLDANGLPLYKIVNGQMVQRDATEIQASAEYKQIRRQNITNKWDAQIDTLRDVIRRMQDEGKPAAAITKQKTNLHNLISQKNTELQGVL